MIIDGTVETLYLTFPKCCRRLLKLQPAYLSLEFQFMYRIRTSSAPPQPLILCLSGQTISAALQEAS